MWMQPDGMTETFTSTGYTCPRCQGNGWHWAVSLDDGSPVKASCIMCNGAGRLDAAISVQWKASPGGKACEKRDYKRETFKDWQKESTEITQ